MEYEDIKWKRSDAGGYAERIIYQTPRMKCGNGKETKTKLCVMASMDNNDELSFRYFNEFFLPEKGWKTDEVKRNKFITYLFKDDIESLVDFENQCLANKKRVDANNAWNKKRDRKWGGKDVFE